MRLSDAGLRRPKTMALDLNHRFPPTLNEDVARDRSNRLLDVAVTFFERLFKGMQKRDKTIEFRRRKCRPNLSANGL
jgi:hypothetical protein